MDDVFDEFGFQIAMVQSYEELVAFSIFDTGASVVTFSAMDQFLFELFGSGGIPIRVPCGAVAEGVGGELVGHVSQPGTIYADGLHIAELTFDEFGFPVFEVAFDPAISAVVPGVQTMVGALLGSEQEGGCEPVASEFLPTITGTPILVPTTDFPIGRAVNIRPIGELLDFSDFPELQGLVLPVPDLRFQSPGTGVPFDPMCTLNQTDICTDPIRIDLDLIGIDNHQNPGNSITESHNPVQSHVTVSDGAVSIPDQVFLFDTGAQLSIISQAQAASLGLDLDNPDTTVSVQGAGGIVTDLPGFRIDALRIPIVGGGTLSILNPTVFVLDVAPGLIDGILGMNLFNNAAAMLYDPYDPAGANLQLTFFTEHFLELPDIDPDQEAILGSLLPGFGGLPNSGMVPQGISVATDISVESAQATGGTQLKITYEIANSDLGASFDVGFYRSTDATFGNDTLLGTVTIGSPGDLTAGAHTKTFTIGTGVGEVALPGLGVSDSDIDYFILAVADPSNAIAEDDQNATNEDNYIMMSGAYHLATGDVFVHGLQTADAITVTLGATLAVNMNGTIFSYSAADVAGLQIRGHAGADTINGSAVAKAMRIWGGNDNDILRGGSLSDILFGGSGADRWEFVGTALADSIVVQNDAVAGTLKATRGTEIDKFTFDGSDSIRVLGDAGNDTISVNIAVTLAATLEGGPGKDTLNGGGGADLLLGQDQDDRLNGKGNLDTIDGGAGIDGWTFEGTANVDFLDVVWDSAAGRLVARRRLSDGGAAVETDVARFVESLTVLALSGADKVNVSLLGSAELTAAGLTGATIVDGAAGADTIFGTAGKDNLKGGSGADADSLVGNAGNDTLAGGSGNDFLNGGNDNDNLAGGDGNDTLLAEAGNDTLNGNLGDDVINGGTGTDSWTFQGTSAVDYLDADWDGVSQLVAKRRLTSGGTIVETDRASFIEKMTLLGLAANDRIDVSAIAAADVASAGLTSPIVLDGGGGSDTVFGSAGRDSILGGSGADIDSLFGNAGNDTLNGGQGDDVIDAGDGNDSVLGGDGNDNLKGGLGDDTLNGGNQIDTIDGGLGTDVCSNGEFVSNCP